MVQGQRGYDYVCGLHLQSLEVKLFLLVYNALGDSED